MLNPAWARLQVLRVRSNGAAERLIAHPGDYLEEPLMGAYFAC